LALGQLRVRGGAQAMSIASAMVLVIFPVDVADTHH